MKRVAAITIPRGFPNLKSALRQNIGNLMFTEAVYRNIDAEVVRFPLAFDAAAINDGFDAVVIPAANWLLFKGDWTDFNSRLRRLKVPVTMIGLGLQSDGVSTPQVVPSAIELAQIIADQSPALSLRGPITQDYLAGIGITNTVVTGCPSLYMQVMPEMRCNPEGGIVVQSTRYVIGRKLVEATDINRRLFSIAGRHELDMVYQSEFAETDYLALGSSPEWREQPGMKWLPPLYGLRNLDEMEAWLDRHGRMFPTIPDWAAYLQTKAGVVGSRLHGSILALNSGVPAVLFPHDTRTQELVDFAAIPSADPQAFFASNWRRFWTTPGYRDQLARYYQRREENLVVYKDFLRMSGLSYRTNEPAEAA